MMARMCSSDKMSVQKNTADWNGYTPLQCVRKTAMTQRTQRTKGHIPWEKISCPIGPIDKILEPQKM